jgi:hypothetical protein
MNSLQLENGGRPFTNDDLQTLQDRDALLGLPALLAGLNPCVVSGCRLWQTGSAWNVGAGMVWDGVNLLDFSGRSNVSLPAMFAPGGVTMVDERAYQTGGIKTTIKEQRMDLVPAVAGAPNLVVNPWGCLRYEHLVKAAQHELGDVKFSANLITANFEAGVGKPGTSAWGWALCDGQGGRIDLREKFIVAHNPANPEYAVGATGGEATVTLGLQHLPNHNHGLGLNYGQSNNGQSSTNVRTDSQNLGSLNRNTASVGGGQAHNNLPPFYTLAALQWVGY